MTGDGEKIDVRYMADLARIALTEPEILRFEGDLGRILGYMSQLQELDVTGIEPTAHATRVQNVFRTDEPHAGLNHDVVMSNAPRSDSGQFLVPRILE